MHRIHHLVALHAVHRTGSFAVAARELGYTPSAISQQIAALERDTGLVLFEREAAGVRATASAHRLVELSRRLLAEVDELDHEVRRLATGSAGRIRLGAFPTAGVHVVPPVLALLADTAPGVDVSLDEGEPDELADAVADGRLDVALVYEYGPCPRRWPAGITVEPLLREQLLLLRGAGTTTATAATAELAELDGQRWIVSGPGTAGAESLTRLCAAAGFTPSVAFRSDNYDVVRELVAATGGMAVVPALAHRPDPRIAASPLPQPTAHRTVLAALRTGSSNPVLPVFVDVLRRALPYGKLTFCAGVDVAAGVMTLSSTGGGGAADRPPPA